jgi:hypothetical protein
MTLSVSENRKGKGEIEVTMTKAALILVALSLMAGVVAGENTQPSRKELNELQEKCSSKADEFVSKQGGHQGFFVEYDSHYNVELNSCFVYIRLSRIIVSGFINIYSLYDVDENRQYDTITFYTDTPEKEIREFKKRIKPYMTE